MQFSIIVPTLNESQNIDLLLTRLFALHLDPGNFEVIIVDDNSTDGTPEKVRIWTSHANVHLIERRGKPDLTASILAGVAAAHSNAIVVMDADLSHPPEQLLTMVTPILDNNYDVVIGSRYKAGGSTENWPLYRHCLSRIGGWLARSICDVSDATSGFFAFRRELSAHISDKAYGYKILLELLMAGQGKYRILEVPICFRDRMHGTSKLSISHQWAYLQRLMILAGGAINVNTAGRFALVGLLGVFIDAFVFQWLINQAAGLATAHILGFLAAATVNYALNSKWAFRQHHTDCLKWNQFARFLTVGALALLLRGGILALLVYVGHIPATIAIYPAIIATAIVNYFGAAFYVFPDKSNLPSVDIRWRVASIGIVIFIILLRLVYSGLAQLIPDEAYYWNYAQHMDLSFFDHPPMVAWLIWLGTGIMGQNEFGVRIGAFLCGLVAMGYLYAFAYNLYGKSTAMRAVMLLAVLPFGFSSGLLMIPDAPLVAAWIATLYYMERALINGRNSAWLGMGIAFGLGILSKYTLGLLGIAALVFVIIDPTARRWMKRPHPYLAAILALLLFSPVIIWNIENNWASFLFQSTRLLADDYHFSVHYLILHIIIMLTPVGFFAAAFILFSYNPNTQDQYEHRRRLFVQIFTGIPLLIFLILSTFDLPRFHWTGPIWLAILPTIAWMIGQTGDMRVLSSYLRKAWQPTLIICMFIYAFILHYVVLGIPGIPYQIFAEHYFWREATIEIERIVETVQHQTGKKPIVVGMSKWSVASALSFYNQNGSHMDIRSRNMFGDSAAMYDFWFPSQQPTNRPIILVGMKRHQLERNQAGDDLSQMLDQPDLIQYRMIDKHGIPLRRVYYRMAQGFTGKIEAHSLN
ncbi:dolichol-phosphate mannosyltransferase [Nitrosomonas cryotolerans]|uniref:Dolichol-phosphate mannosyltransferase n=1 Tax=Nitrosomonas cryotolerans ATCC 49181 TaxID=1131553 RepID=A0A1N6GJD6_9PROT|nr:glycosyltransferase family 39 protein [Nitrosomonas cryotolerans]SFP56362.1 dolichol-phosphate mannosyltransferase [Nitrosomonas cryotolerans]SIO07626.1 dolichol-phosphate mannosyltransferase [Nitrosomonas cryotolerans ATCC 49181]